MNAFITQLSEQQTLQSFLIKIIQYLLKYFKTINLQSQEKTYGSINRICKKIQQKFMREHAIESVSKKLRLNIQTKINDRQEEVQSNCKQSSNNKKKIIHGMKSFITNIQSTIQSQKDQRSQSPEILPLDPPTRMPSTESEYSWIRKTVIEELELLKDDIREAEDTLEAFLEQAIGRNLGLPRTVLFFQSFLNNNSIIQTISLLGWTPVIVRNQKKAVAKKEPTKQAQQGKKHQGKTEEKQTIKYISIMEISSYLHRCHSVIISSDSITKTGGVLSSSGSLMMCMMARKRKIPVIVISRNYCLSDRVLLSQKSLTSSVNASQFFKIQHNDFGLYITKDHDYIQPKYIDLMITQRGCWMVDDISHVQDQYWRY